MPYDYTTIACDGKRCRTYDILTAPTPLEANITLGNSTKQHVYVKNICKNESSCENVFVSTRKNNNGTFAVIGDEFIFDNIKPGSYNFVSKKSYISRTVEEWGYSTRNKSKDIDPTTLIGRIAGQFCRDVSATKELIEFAAGKDRKEGSRPSDTIIKMLWLGFSPAEIMTMMNAGSKNAWHGISNLYRAGWSYDDFTQLFEDLKQFKIERDAVLELVGKSDSATYVRSRLLNLLLSNKKERNITFFSRYTIETLRANIYDNTQKQKKRSSF